MSVKMEEEQLHEIHNYSSYHKKMIRNSSVCGCFYCCRTFEPVDIEEWVDGGQTAICPYCGIDSVIPGASGIDVDDEELLKEMYKYYFTGGTTYRMIDGVPTEIGYTKSEWELERESNDSGQNDKDS